MRAVIYARISEDHKRAESVPTQIANGTRYAERMGSEVVRVFKDEGRSGYTGELRPGFDRTTHFRRPYGRSRFNTLRASGSPSKTTRARH